MGTLEGEMIQAGHVMVSGEKVREPDSFMRRKRTDIKLMRKVSLDFELLEAGDGDVDFGQRGLFDNVVEHTLHAEPEIDFLQCASRGRVAGKGWAQMVEKWD